MLSMISLLALVGVAHGSCPAAYPEANADFSLVPSVCVCKAAGAGATTAPADSTTEAPAVTTTEAPAAVSSNATTTLAPASSNATTTQAPAPSNATTTQAPAPSNATTTQAPAATTTLAPTTTVAPAGNASNASNSSNSSNSSGRQLFSFGAQKRQLSAHSSICPAGYAEAVEEVSANTTNSTTDPPEASFTTTLEVVVAIEIPATDEGKAAVANLFGFGLHATSCKGVENFWSKLSDCMLGISNTEGMSFDMALAIDSQLGATPAPCTFADCYGAAASETAAPSRLLAAVDLTNSGQFTITAKATSTDTDMAAVQATVQEAATAMDRAKEDGGALSPAAAAETFGGFVEKAAERPTMSGKLLAAGVNTTAMVAAAKAAQVSVEVGSISTNAVTPASTSGAYTMGACGALFIGAAFLLM